MVAGWAHGAKSGRYAVGNHQIGGLHQRTSGPQGSDGGVRVHAGVWVDPEVAFFGSGIQDALHVFGRVGACELCVGGQGRVIAAHVVQQALGQQHVIDGAQALGTFGMIFPHFVACAVEVRDVSG